MASIYSGIHLKLKSPQTPWKDKLKLARFAWMSSQCLLPNKEQVLLDWCAHALTGWYSKKVEFSQNVLEGLWCYLDDLVHSRKVHTPLKQDRTPTLRLNMAQLLLDRLHECVGVSTGLPECVPTMLSVCQGILASPALSCVFTTKYELMVSLLAKVCLFACHELQHPLLTGNKHPDVNPTTKAHDLDSSQMDVDTESPDQQEEHVEKSKSKEPLGSAKLFELLLQVLSCYITVQRQQANLNRVVALVTGQLIQPLFLLRHLLTSGEHTPSHTHLGLRQQLCRDIRIKTDLILQIALFPPEHLTSYKEELFPAKEDHGKRGTGGAKGRLKPSTAIISKLSQQGYCKPVFHYAVRSNTLPLLFKLFVESYRRGRGESEEDQRMLCFYFLTRLIPALDVNLDGHLPTKTRQQKDPQEPPCSPESWSLGLLAVESLLSQALSADTYNVAADRIRHGEVQLNFYRALGQTLFNQAQPSIPAWYRCLKMLLGLNHLILEPDLDQLLSSAWVNAECMEARVQRARQLMLCSLLQTYTKLRQLPRLFSELMSVICQPALDNLRPPLLSTSVHASLRTCVLDTPPSQGLEICSRLLESLRRCILPDLVRECQEEERMEINQERGSEEVKDDQEREDTSMKLFTFSQLLHVVLFSLKTVDNATPLPLIRQSQRLMEEIHQVHKDLLQLFPAVKSNVGSVKKLTRKGKKNLDRKHSFSSLAPWQQRTQEAALLLRYTWVEVDTLFHLHCSKYSSPEAATIEMEESAPVLMHMEGLLSGEALSVCLHPSIMSPFTSPMSCLHLKLLTLQQMKKVLLDDSFLAKVSTATLLNRAASFILAKQEIEEEEEKEEDEEQVWDRQIGSVNYNSYHVAHWYLVTTNLPLIVPHLSGEGVGCIANTLVRSLLRRRTDRGKDCPPGSLTITVVSSQLLESPILPEMPSLFSATLCSLACRVFGVLMAAGAPKVCQTLLKFEEAIKGARGKGDPSQHLSSLVNKEAMVEDILASSQSGEVFVSLTQTQTDELLHLLRIIASLNPDGMSSEDLSSIFFLLFFMFTSTSGPSEQTGKGDDALFVQKLLRLLTQLLEGRNFPGILKVIHGGTLLQATLSSLLRHSSNGRFCGTSSSDWSGLIKAAQEFIGASVHLIIARNSSIRLNLNQYASYHSSKELTSRQTDPGESMLSVHLLLASLTSFSKAMTSNLGRNKLVDQTLSQTIARATSSLGPAIESVLKQQTDGQSCLQPGSILSQAFVVEVVTVMLHSELSLLSTEDKPLMTHMTLYRGLYQQILKEISSAARPMDFLVYSLHFLSAFYTAVRKMRGEVKEPGVENEGETELNEVFLQILQVVHRLLTAPWLSPSEAFELEPAVQELLRHLVEECTTGQMNLLLLMIRDRLDVCKLRAGNQAEVLSAVVIVKLLSCCALPEACSKALWLFAPQILTAMVSLVQLSSQDASLTRPFSVPVLTSMTMLLRQGEGLISNPHHVILCLGALQSVPLDHLAPLVYQSMFLAVHEALFAIIQCQPQVMRNAAPSYLNVFHRLLASIMQEGRQRGDSDTGADSEVFLQCSRLIERMYSHIAAVPESFTTLSAFMVAQYVTELQKVTLRPDIKLHLTEGIYSVLDLCKEQDIKFLMGSLPMGVREVFNELHSSYNHYHKSKKQGEEKYTV